MVTQSRVVFWSACAVMLILACFICGCSTPQSPAAPEAPATPAGPAAPAVTTPVPAAASATVMIKNFAFSPATLMVKPGTTVTWTNGDGASHVVASDAGGPVPFSSPTLATGATYQFTFTQAGTYAYHCSIHPSMKGTIIVQS